MLKASKILTPDNLPEGDEEFNFVYRKLRKLDKIVRKLKQKPSPERAIIIKKLKGNFIPELKRNIISARADISQKEERQKVVEGLKMGLLNQHPPGSQEYEDAKLLHGTSCCLISYQTTLLAKIRKYEDYVQSCERVLNSWSQ